MSSRSALGVLFLMIVMLTACKKDKDPEPDYVALIANDTFKDWRLEKVTYVMFNVSDRIPDCQKDEIYRFYASGRGELRSGPIPCESADPTVVEPEVQASGNWEFTEGGKKMLVHWDDKQSWADQQDWVVTVNELTADKLVVTGTVFDNYIVTATFRPL